MTGQKAEREVMPADFLIGERVVDAQEEDVGKLEELMVDAANGRVRYAIISFGGIFGLGEKLFALPWGMLQHDVESRRFILPTSRQQLKTAPGFDPHSWPEMDREWEQRIHRYYDQTPYWEPIERAGFLGGDLPIPPGEPRRE